MAILCDRGTRLLVQGLGRMGQFHAKLSIEYGTKVVAGVKPGAGGSAVDGIPVFDTVRAAVSEQISSYKVPTRWLLVDEAEFPMSVTGKVDRTRVRELLTRLER